MSSVCSYPNSPIAEDQSRDVREAAQAIDRRIEIATPVSEQELEQAFISNMLRCLSALIYSSIQGENELRHWQRILMVLMA
jgi:hypothetical protein